MRKIDKSILYSTKYKNWLEALEKNGESHPKYESSGEFYVDVKLELLRCQNGLCAYTEMRLCDLNALSKDKWGDGRYKDQKVKTAGQVEHFDSALKKEKGWLWSNFFAADDRINMYVKRTDKVTDLMKPDHEDYDPKKRIEFDSKEYVYRASSMIENKNEREEIDRMIEVLGINYPGHVWSRRKAFVLKLKEEIKRGIFNLTDYQNTEFPTALSFILDETKPQI